MHTFYDFSSEIMDGQHIQSPERNRLSTNNIISSKTVFQKTNVNLRHSQINKNLKRPSPVDAPYKMC